MVCLQMVLLRCFLNKQVSAFFFQEQFVNAVEEFQSCLDLQTKHLEADDRLIAETYPLIFQNSLNVQFTLVQYPMPPPSAALSFKHLIYLFIYLLVIFMQAGPVQLQVEWGHAWDVPSKTKCIQKYKIQKEPTMHITIYT